MKFAYKAKTQDGQLQEGAIDGATLDSAIKTLQGYKLVVLEIAPIQQLTLLDRILGKRRGIPGKELTLFMRQFATLLESQVPLADALKTLLVQTTNPRLKESIFDLISDIDAGLPLSQAMARQTHLFGDFYVQMVRSGEVSGRLEETFTYLADYSEHEYELNSKAKSAATYPAFIIIVFLIIGSIITISLAPQMAALFEEYGTAQIPLMTKILMGIGQFLSQWGVIVLICLIGFVLAILNYFKTPEGKRLIDFWILRVPIIGKIYKNIYVARFCESAGTLIKGAIPLVTAFEVAGAATGNYLFAQIGVELGEGIKKGELVSKILAHHPEFFPQMVSQMAAVGEASGRIDELLQKIASYYQKEVDRAFNNLVDLLQPILIVLIGGLVGLLVAAVLLPIYQLAQSIG